MTDVVRWVFQDMETNETYRVEINPNEMSGYVFPKSFNFARYGSGRLRGVQGRREPLDLTFGGVVRTKTHHDRLLEWQRKPGKVRVTDHLGRTFEMMIKSVDMIDRRPTGSTTWRFRYTFNCLLLRRVA
jgi:hypothetical protein